MSFSLVLNFVKKYAVWILLATSWTLFVQGTFYTVQNSQAQNLVRSIHGQLRQELAVSNFHFLSRNLMDLESSRTMKCIRLTLKGEKNITILNTSYRGTCEEHRFLLQGAKVKTELRSINGDLFDLEFISLNSSPFFIALWLIRTIGILQILSFFLYQKAKAEKDRAVFELEQKHTRKLVEIASQVSHDIRSPLSALSMLIGTLKDLPADKKNLVLHATQRINDIANNLLQKSSQSQSESTSHTTLETAIDTRKFSNEYIPHIVEMIVSEKRLQYQDHPYLRIESDLSQSFGTFANIDPTEFGRCLSNLINNAAESLVNNSGQVLLTVKKVTTNSAGNAIITISDNGKGIPKKFLKNIGEKGVSYGKNGTQSGSGLGVYHAKMTINSFGGDLLIESHEGRGTTITIMLPCIVAPNWFAQELNLEHKKYLVSLDDDPNIHQLWANKIVNTLPHRLEHITFHTGDDLELYVNKNIRQLKETLFLIDHDLENQNRTGLQIIEDLVIEKYAILVTSHAYEIPLQNHASRRGLKMLPKSLAGLAPMKSSVDVI